MKQMTITYTHSHHLGVISCLLALLLLASCQDDAMERSTGSLRVSAFAYEGPVVSRASYTDFSNIYGATPANPLQMSFWATYAGFSKRSDSSFDGTQWSTSCRLEPATYDFYSYLPKSIESEGVTVTLDNTVSPATMTFANVPAVMRADILISASTPSGESGNGNAGTEASVNPYDQKIDNSEGQIVTFRMDHVLAKLSFSFSNPTGKAFTDLRQIVVREVQVIPNTWAPRWNLVCTLNKGTAISYAATGIWDGSTIDYYIYNTTPITMGGTTVEGYLVEQKAYGESASEVFGSCYVVPNDAHEIAIRVIYDVYDKTGQLIRANEIVVNNQLKVTKTDADPILAGTEYKIDVKIIPDYLFMLADVDAGNSLEIQTTP